MKQEAKISVIVPVYGVERYISDCIRSLCDQTWKNLEILLIDDGSKYFMLRTADKAGQEILE